MGGSHGSLTTREGANSPPPYCVGFVIEKLSLAPNGKQE
nr:MAG TPA_asm: hypothetical protein [Caudoviricetes sp.]